ncbi:hypothetical protein C1J03_03225 [Sulfitobacter sp. SK012]|uniref:hypothetical protein n=1 Tax=Sulfitobacter sp. SK012 TaxID=1389005 RepID=UPI000E0B03B4|nr:hypothetical protein [Sulfitobacter sp. SK012]AXI45133.1 hypothetical protein C1J03_03225 [Sulfitobacter sp. SK012]
MKNLLHSLRTVCLAVFILSPLSVWAADFDRFVGNYEGSADVVIGDEAKPRDIKTLIEADGDGFTLRWTSVIYRNDGDVAEKVFMVDFDPSQRPSIYSSAMKSNLFGKQVPLDPLKGEPFVWARFEGDTFTVYSLYINTVGEYELQEYHRTLTEGGLNLLFRRVRNAVPEKEITAFIKRQD